MPRRKHKKLTDAFGARVRDLRLARGLSLGNVKRKTSLTMGHLSDIERGFAAPNIETICRIAQGLGIHPAALLAFQDDEEYGQIIDLVCQLSNEHLIQLRKILTAWIHGENKEGKR